MTDLHNELAETQNDEIQAIPLELEVQDVLIDETSIWILSMQQVTKLNRETLVVERKFQHNDWIAVTFIKANNILWILNRPVSRNGYIAEIDVNTGETKAIYETGRYPMDMEFDGEHLWVANFSDDTVTKIRVSDGTLVGTFPVGRGPLAIAFDGSDLWVANSNDNTVMLLNVDTGNAINSYRVEEYPSTVIAVDSAVWLAHARDNSIMKVDSEHAAPIAQFTLSSCTYQLGECGISSLAFDGSGIWATVSLADQLVRFDLRNEAISDRISFPEGSRPGNLRYAQGDVSDYLFVVHGSSRFFPPSTISRIELEVQSE